MSTLIFGWSPFAPAFVLAGLLSCFWLFWWYYCILSRSGKEANATSKQALVTCWIAVCSRYVEDRKKATDFSIVTGLDLAFCYLHVNKKLLRVQHWFCSVIVLPISLAGSRW